MAFCASTAWHVAIFRELFTLPVSPTPNGSVDRYPSSRYALLELKPETGRRHLNHLAHPIIGDGTRA